MSPVPTLAVPASATRRIFLRGHRVMARIGIHEFERAGPQPLSIDVDLWLRPQQGDLGDDIANTLDYDFLRVGIARLVGERHWNLQETLCHAILDLCFASDKVAAARVSTEKTAVYPDCDSVGYEAARARDP